MESLEGERNRSNEGLGGAGPEVGIATAGAVVGSSLVFAATGGASFWLDIVVHLVVFAVAFVAGIRNGRGLGLLMVVLSPVVMFWGLSQFDLSDCFVYGGSDPKCDSRIELVIGAYVVGTVLLAVGVLDACRPRVVPVAPGSMRGDQTPMERYQTDLLELRRQGAIKETEYQTRLLELRCLARPRAEGAITDDEFEAAAARLLD